VKRLGLATCAASGALLLAGCSHAHTRRADRLDVGENAGPTSVRWKSVIDDWFHGGIDHKHSCAAVKAAILHLPQDPLEYSTVNEDLAAYERVVC